MNLRRTQKENPAGEKLPFRNLLPVEQSVGFYPPTRDKLLNSWGGGDALGML